MLPGSQVGSGFTVETHDAPPGAIGTLVRGAPLPAGAVVLNVEAYLGSILGTWLTTVADANGFAEHSLPIPFGYVWDGSLGLQSVWLAPPSCGNGPFVTSNALR